MEEAPEEDAAAAGAGVGEAEDVAEAGAEVEELSAGLDSELTDFPSDSPPFFT